MKHILICPDSFKGTLTSLQAAECIREGLREVLGNDCEYRIQPIADGGEGTVDAVLYGRKGQRHSSPVRNPLREEIMAEYGVMENTAVIEMAASSGLCLISEKERDPLNATTFGVGQQIKEALSLQVKKIIIGIGGSATNDGGIGMAGALGVRFLNESGEELSAYQGPQILDNLASVDISNLDPRIAKTEIVVFSDVENPLLGPRGATTVYGPQKGVTDIAKFEKLLSHLREVVERDLGKDMNAIVGGGAAGGLGAGLAVFLNAHMTSGIEMIAKLTDLHSQIKKADIVITGEGCMDDQTSFGKAPAFIAKLTKKYGKTAYALNGFLKSAPDTFNLAWGTNSLPNFDAKNVSKNALPLLRLLSKRLAQEKIFPTMKQITPRQI